MTDKHDFFGELYSWTILQPQSPIITAWLAWARVRLREMEVE